MQLQTAQDVSEVLVARTPTMREVVARIGERVDDFDLAQLRDVARLIDVAAFNSDGQGLSGVLLGFMVGLEVGSGMAPTERTDKCRDCDTPYLPTERLSRGFCSVLCEDRLRARERYHRRVAIAQENGSDSVQRANLSVGNDRETQ